MRPIFAAGLLTAALACGGNNNNGDDDGNGDGGGTPDACVGLECNIVDCQTMAQPPTTLVGKVYAPNGTLPLYGADVYIPREDPGAFAEGAQCSRCSTDLPGRPIVAVKTNEAGEFRLENVPAGADIPVVIALGKWRRQIRVSTVAQCTDNNLDAQQTRLPKNRTEGDIPRIAVTTGNADALECLVRKIGIEDSEIGKDGGDHRIHLYAGNGANKIQGNGDMPDAESLWSNPDKLKTYDISIFSCEGSQLNGSDKTQQMVDNVQAYANLGGRVFLSHWHNIWISGKYQGGVGAPQPAGWTDIAEWSNNGNPGNNSTTATIDENQNPKGMSFATWMLNVQGSTQRGLVPVTQYRKQAVSVDPTKAEQWVYLTPQQDGPSVQNFQFTTPVDVAPDARCGKVVFSDMHVSADSSSPSGSTFPNECSNAADLTPQEKALAFMFFDIASCVGGIL